MDLSGKTILVLGAYGFIGAPVVRALRACGADVVGFVRSPDTAARILPGLPVATGDLRAMTTPGDWDSVLTGVECVVNCAGALQDGPEDDLEAVHHSAIAALAGACGHKGISVVQISAIGATPGADTDFMRTKAAGDAALQSSAARVWVLRPGLVIGQSDYGGTALLRMLAAVPVVQPIAYPNTPVQSIGMDDLIDAVLAAVAETLPEGSYDLVERRAHTLAEVAAETRLWLGFTPARVTLAVPGVMVRAVSRCADGLGRLGWRAPLRSTAMTVMASGVVGDPSLYEQATGRVIRPLPQIYAGLPCAREHRLTARMTLMMPVVAAALGPFWVLSGVMGLLSPSQATLILTQAGWSFGLAAASVIFWALVDIALGLAVLWRPWAAKACLAQVGVCVVYLVAATMVVPGLWLDPLGPLVKILPAMTLSLVALPLLQSR